MTGTRSPARAVLAAALVAVLATALGPLAPAVDAQEPGDVPAAGARLLVSDIVAVVGPGAPTPPVAGAEPPTDVSARLLVVNGTDEALADLRVVVELHEPVTTRSELRRAVDDGVHEGRRLVLQDLTVREDGELPGGAIAQLAVTITADEGGWAERRESAILPLSISLVRGTEVLDVADTAVVHLAEPPAEPLDTVVVVPVDDAPWRGPQDVYAPGVDAAADDDARLDRIVAGLEAHPRAGVTIAPAPHLLEDLRDRADGYREATSDGEVREVPPESAGARRANVLLRRVRDLVQTLPLPPVVGPYADADVAGLAAAPSPLPGIAATSLSEARRRLTRLVDRQPQAAFHATVPLAPATLDLVPGDHLLLPWSAVEGPSLDVNPSSDIPDALRQTRTPAGRTLTATVADPWVTLLLDRPDVTNGPVLAGHRVAVETAALWMRAPNAAGRALLAMPSRDWAPPPRFAETALDALTAAPWLRLTDPAAQAARGGTPAAMTLRDGVGELPTDLVGELRATEEALEAARAALPEGANDIGGRAPDALREQLLRAPSTWLLPLRVDRSRALLRDARAAVDASLGTVEVPVSATITLTSDRGAIPVTLQRTEGPPVRVRVTVDSQGRLAWPQGESRDVVLTGDGAQTVSFEAVALGRGTFPVTVRVSDPSGRRVLEQVTLSVRSTSISRPALIGMGAVILLLVVRGLWRRGDDGPRGRRGDGRRPARRLEVVR
ncbi:MAG: DUF6049 family protein [Actinomycetes bacterium]